MKYLLPSTNYWPVFMPAIAQKMLKLYVFAEGFRRLVGEKGYAVERVINSNRLRAEVVKVQWIRYPVLDGINILTCMRIQN